MTRGLFYVCLLAAIVSLALGGWLINFWILGIAGLALAGLWAGQRTRRAWMPSFGLAGFAICAGLGAWAGVPALLMLLSLTAALAAWDLDRFTARMVLYRPLESIPKLEKQHLIRLGASCGVGLLLGAAGVLVRTTLGFAVILFFGLLAGIGLGQFVYRMRKDSDQ